MERILNFLNDDHPIQLIADVSNLNISLNYKQVKTKKIKLSFDLNSGILPIAENKKKVTIKNLDIPDISSVFFGMFEDDIRFGLNIISIPFQINPPYISFKLN